jgi:hypothetical protein
LAEVAGLVEVAAVFADRSNGFAETWLEPFVCEEDDVDEVSDLMASNADDTAPKTNTMAEPPTNAAPRGD